MIFYARGSIVISFEAELIDTIWLLGNRLDFLALINALDGRDTRTFRTVEQ